MAARGSPRLGALAPGATADGEPRGGGMTALGCALALAALGLGLYFTETLDKGRL